jgi:hypothetical protein
MLERERAPVDDDIEALIAQRGRNGWRVANAGMDRTHVTGVSFCPRLSSVRSTPRWVNGYVTASEMLPVPPIERTRTSMT